MTDRTRDDRLKERDEQPGKPLHPDAADPTADEFQSAIGETPVHNVSVPVMERDFWLFELSGISEATSPVH
jgi:hypothetical protein